MPVVLERSNRKTLAIHISQEVCLIVKAPSAMPEQKIIRFLQQKQFWIYKQAKHIMENNQNKVKRSEEEIRRLREEARKILTAKSNEYAKQLGVTFDRIRIGNQKTRWGSCSSNRTISYNWHLVLMPESIIDYVVVHELCHLLEMNHSKRFWDKVAGVLPDYAERRIWLRKNGGNYLS